MVPSCGGSTGRDGGTGDPAPPPAVDGANSWCGASVVRVRRGPCRAMAESVSGYSRHPLRPQQPCERGHVGGERRRLAVECLGERVPARDPLLANLRGDEVRTACGCPPSGGGG